MTFQQRRNAWLSAGFVVLACGAIFLVAPRPTSPAQIGHNGRSSDGSASVLSGEMPRPTLNASAHHTMLHRPGMVVVLEQLRHRPLSSAERTAVHDILKQTVEAWRHEQAVFVVQSAHVLHTSPSLIEQTLPPRGWARLGATRDPRWTSRLAKTLHRRILPTEQQQLNALAHFTHAKVVADREHADRRIAAWLGISPADVASAWPPH